MKNAITAAFWAAFVITISIPVHGHHGFAQYFDRTDQVRIEGTIHRVDISNPHTHLEVAVTNDNGGVDIWSCETQAKTLLDRKGIDEADFELGAPIVVTGSQARRDATGCEVGTIYFSSGEAVTLRTAEGRAVIAVNSESQEVNLKRDSIFGRWVRNSFAGNPTEAGFLDAINDLGRAANSQYNSFFDDPSLHCSSSTAVRIWIAPGNPSEIRQEGDRIVMQHEFMDTSRIIYLNEQAAPQEVSPSAVGFSLGRFEGDELIVETSNFLEGVLLSHVGPGSDGVVHSDQLKLVERYRVDELGDLIFSWEATDGKYFSEPIRGGLSLSPTSLDLGLYNCVVTVSEGDIE